jgi:hypothetical protein
MKNVGRLIFAVSMSAASTFAIWVMAMEYANKRLGIPLPVCILLIAAAMAVVGLGLGARTVRTPGLGGFLPVVLSVIAVLPLAVWRASWLAMHDVAVPLMGDSWRREFVTIVFAVLVPCVAGIYVIRSIARKAGLDRA